MSIKQVIKVECPKTNPQLPPAIWRRQGAKRVLWYSNDIAKVNPVNGEVVSSFLHGHPSEPLLVVQQCQGLILADGPAWHHTRRVCSHGFYQVRHLDMKSNNNHFKQSKRLFTHLFLPLNQAQSKVRG